MSMSVADVIPSVINEKQAAGLGGAAGGALGKLIGGKKGAKIGKAIGSTVGKVGGKVLGKAVKGFLGFENGVGKVRRVPVRAYAAGGMVVAVPMKPKKKSASKKKGPGRPRKVGRPKK